MFAILQILQVALSLDFCRFNLPTSFNINLSLYYMSEMRVANSQSGRLDLCCFLRVNSLENSFLDPMSDSHKSVALE